MLRRLLIGSSRARALVGLFCCLVASFVTSPHPFASNVQSAKEARNAPNEDESANVFEAVVRYQIESWNSRRTHIAFLSREKTRHRIFLDGSLHSR